MGFEYVPEASNARCNQAVGALQLTWLFLWRP